MLSRFFVDRPIFAWVIAIVIMLAGALSIFNLPVSQYPNIAPPQVRINATYPGANAETMSRTVTQIIEQNMTGLDGLMYMSSYSDSTGRMAITLTFVAGTNPDIAQVQVQNKLSAAEPNGASARRNCRQELGLLFDGGGLYRQNRASWIRRLGRLPYKQRRRADCAFGGRR